MLAESVIKRFWKYVDKRGPDDCWPWTGSRMIRGGYGQLNDRGKLLKSHRVSYEIHNGPIPEGKFICHICNNSPCCNPRHLYAGTAADNWKDTIQAGHAHRFKIRRGSECGRSRITEKQIKIIRNSKLNCAELGRKFGVTRQAIWLIRKGKNWKHI